MQLEDLRTRAFLGMMEPPRWNTGIWEPQTPTVRGVTVCTCQPAAVCVRACVCVRTLSLTELMVTGM